MKKLFSFLIAILIAVPIISLSESKKEADYETARSIANFMETHYDVSVLIGSECQSAVKDNSFTLGVKPQGRTPFLNALELYSYTNEIQMVDDAFSIYPPDFFDKFKCDEAPNGLRILIPDQILYEGSSMAGVSTVEDGYYNIFLAVGMFNHLNIHHEIWHAMEFRITADNPHVFDHWTDLNPDGFQYSEDYFGMDIWEQAEPQEDWFARGYSTIDEMEDRATVIEALFRHDPDWWAERPHLQKKLDFLLEAAEPMFGNVYFYE